MKYEHVTQVLAPYQSWSGIDPTVLGIAASRGQLVHMACASYARGLFTPSLKDVAGFLFDSFRKWFDENVAEVLAVEEKATDEVLKYVGIADLIVRLNDGGVWVLDIKTPAAESMIWRGQLAAYWNLFKDLYRIDRAGSLMVSRIGKRPRVVEYVYKDDDFAAFTFALMAYRYFRG